LDLIPRMGDKLKFILTTSINLLKPDIPLAGKRTN
jgi:hypothetical protein